MVRAEKVRTAPSETTGLGEGDKPGDVDRSVHNQRAKTTRADRLGDRLLVTTRIYVLEQLIRLSRNGG